MTRVKICGISEVAHALAAVEAGADFIGMVFAPSKRQVALKRAKEIALAVKSLSPHPVVVGVFVNTAAAEVNRTADYCGLDWVQFSGDEPWEYFKQVERPFIKAIRVSMGAVAEEVLAEIGLGHKLLQRDFIVLLDSHVEGSYGGTGQAFDWGLAAQVAERVPVIIAGGLSAENVSQAIKLVRPRGVDVSSGVESEGVKDAAKIRDFVLAARTADEGQRNQRSKARKGRDDDGG